MVWRKRRFSAEPQRSSATAATVSWRNWVARLVACLLLLVLFSLSAQANHGIG
jgi:hypothetical protein